MNKLKEKEIDIPVIMATGENNIRIAIEVMKVGAYDYVSKDEIFKGGLSLALKKTLERYREKKERQRLEAETKEYAKKLEKANEQLKKLDQMKDNFISMVSHELRTPLTTMKEFTSIIADEIPGKLTKDQKEYIGIIQGNIDRLARLINDLLDISKIEAGKLELKKEFVNITKLVKDTVTTLKPKLDEKQIEIKTSFAIAQPNIYIDPDKIIQVFTNLISNAIKFTPEKGQIIVEITDKEKEIECCVNDTGRGISREDIDKVFDKFQQFGRAAGAGTQGTGLGLAISKELIQAHKGEIRVESELDKGSKFIFTLPIVK
ncbi:MAG: ATP-binding protein [Candidatus Omnitrophota bacterium]